MKDSIRFFIEEIEAGRIEGLKHLIAHARAEHFIDDDVAHATVEVIDALVKLHKFYGND